ncbi:MAG TPA: GNAT family N-acetyltransferase [Cyclobacteriaceae bacterium]|jgi:ribosomal protein S18 acetylase RimI-like enzyme|nr:GNAT family N-acetyltransferase [Cyclobacteriaceae bacterium]
MKDQLEIRLFAEKDKDAVWDIIHKVVANGETYVFHPDSSRDKMLAYWLAPDKQIYVAILEGKAVGTFTLKPNQPDRGAHIANASYMVSPDHEGKGIGTFMAKYSLEEAKRLGYLAMQFNIVIKSNENAIALWKKVGFEIIGEIPNAFNHPRLGMTNAYVMYKEL